MFWAICRIKEGPRWVGLVDLVLVGAGLVDLVLAGAGAMAVGPCMMAVGLFAVAAVGMSTLGVVDQCTVAVGLLAGAATGVPVL